MDMDIINQNLVNVKTEQIKTSDFKKKEQLKEVCAGFEAIFLNKMIKSMRESVPKDSLFGESNSMNIYKSMYDQALSDQLSKQSTSNIGIKEFLFEQLKGSL